MTGPLNDWFLLFFISRTLIETSGASPLYFRSNKFVPLQSLNLMREHGQASQAPWCGFQGQKATGSSADLTSRVKAPRLEDVSKKKIK